MLLTIVSPVATKERSADSATSVENCGESETTNMPHANRNIIKGKKGIWKINGESRQQSPEAISDREATFLLPILRDQFPPTAQLILPIPIIKKEQKPIFRPIPGLILL